MLPIHGAWVRFLVKELDPTCHNEEGQLKSSVPQLRPGTAKGNKTKLQVRSRKKKKEIYLLKGLTISLDKYQKSKKQNKTKNPKNLRKNPTEMIPH